MRTNYVAKAILFDQDDCVLLMRRSNTDDKRPGGQDFPGGGIEPGEDFASGVSREIREESGLTIAPHDLRLVYTATEIAYGNNIIRLVYWARISRPEVMLSFEHDEYRWVPADQAYNEFPHHVYGEALRYGRANGLFDE